VDEQLLHAFCSILAAQPDLMQRLVYLRRLNTEAYLAAGVIRNSVWNQLHHWSYEITGTEIDVVYFNADVGTAWSVEQQQLCDELTQAFPHNTWDVVNQAYVHHWYRTDLGKKIPAYDSLEQALACWPETATAIAVALDEHDQFKVLAPFGLHDLMHLKLRWNDTQVSYETFLQRIQDKQFLEKWPKLKYSVEP
jgi:hypothetical protein